MILAALAAWFEPRCTIQGWVRGDATFDGKPTTYWRRALSTVNLVPYRVTHRLSILVLVAGCTCQPRVYPAGAPDIWVAPQRLTVAASFVGYTSSGAVQVGNAGATPALVEVSAGGSLR